MHGSYSTDMRPRVLTSETPEELAGAAARFVKECAREAVDRRRVFRIALAGGRTPAALYARLADQADQAALPWAATDVFWSDERHVPPDHPDSNYRMAFEVLLSRVSVDPARVHRVIAEDPDAERAAADYERTTRRVFGSTRADWPAFDLILLGLGADGHTASLFPGSTALDERERLVLAPFIPPLNVFRITMALPLINHAARVMFLVAGADKAAAVSAALDPPPDATPPPAARVRPLDGELTWMLDREAARFVR
jgi:6-phosphogluconolactonase